MSLTRGHRGIEWAHIILEIKNGFIDKKGGTIIMGKHGLTTNIMTDRVYNRIDNEMFRWSYIRKILQAYHEELQKALLRGERVLIPGVGTLIPEIKLKEKFNMPCCNKEGGNLPYTDIKLTRNLKFQINMTKHYLN